MYCTCYRNFYAEDYAHMFHHYHHPVFEYLVEYKLPEDIVVTPSTETHFFQPSARNRYIRSVTVNGTTEA